MNTKEQFHKIKEASRKMPLLSTQKIDEILLKLSIAIVDSSSAILAANQKDLERMSAEDPKYDRLLLNHERIIGIAGGVKNVARLDSPLGRKLSEKKLENGLLIER